MHPERWQKIQSLFDAAVAMPASERVAYLRQACSGDGDLRAEVEALLAAHAGGEAVLEEEAGGGTPRVAARAPEDMAGRPLGPYRIDHRLGRGSLADVYTAHRDDSSGRRVVIKVVRRGVYTERMMQRIQSERRALASLDHPHIAGVLDSGVTPDGRPYFVMEHVEGLPIDAYCDDLFLSLRQRLELFLPVCEAVHSAHQRLVVHAALKPSNILVSRQRHVMLLDFGLAGLLESDLPTGIAELTLEPAWIVDPRFVSPEQARGEPVTTASDVYSLGALLYRLVCGQVPHDLVGRTQSEISQALSDLSPRPPSEVAPEVGRLLRGDLDSVILMAMHEDPARRYASAAELAADIGRCMTGRAVTAQRDDAKYVVRKFVGRHALPVTATSVVVAFLLSFSALTASQLYRARQENEANTARTEATISIVRAGLDQRIALYGEESLEVARDLETLGAMHRISKDFPEAMPFLQRALAIREAIQGAEHVEARRARESLLSCQIELHEARGDRDLAATARAQLEAMRE